MDSTASRAIILIIVIAAAILIIYGAWKMFSPAYIDKTKYIRQKPAFNPLVTRIGTFNLGPGNGISYPQSGQLFSPYASGQSPLLTGSSDRNAKNNLSDEGKIDFFEMFMA